jgi:integrase/recombinase XerD
MANELLTQSQIASEKLLTTVSTYLENFLSVHTKAAYESDFRDFGRFLSENKVAISHPKDVTKKQVIAYREELRKKYAPTSVNRKLSALASLFSELHNAQVITTNPLDGVKRPIAKTRKERLGFSDSEVNQILESHSTEKLQGLNNRSILTFLFYTGCRISEALTVRVNDLDSIDGLNVVHLQGKGAKLRTLPLHPKLYSLLRELISRRAKEPFDYLFTGVKIESITPLRREVVHTLLKRTLTRLDLAQGRSLHSSRRTVISNLLENGTRLESVAELAGHANMNTTLRYKVRTEKLEDSGLLTLKYKS